MHANGKQVGIVSWHGGKFCAELKYPTGTCMSLLKSYLQSTILTILSKVYARVSQGYTFIKSYIRRWSNSTAKPPVAYPGCVDMGAYYDKGGNDYNCMWYELGDHCEWYGEHFAHVNLTANMACCVCGGGTEV